MLTSPLDRAMVESINQIAHVLGIQTVAEGSLHQLRRQILEDRPVEIERDRGQAV